MIMDELDQSAAAKLFQSFMRFRRVHWLGRTSTGRKPSDIRVLFTIRRGERQHVNGLKVSDISELLHVAVPTVTQLIKGLEASGFVERRMDDEDKRVIRVRMTKRGNEEIVRARKETLNSLNGLVDFLGEEQSEQLAALLAQVCQYYDDPQQRLAAEEARG
ncbi:MarR family winged helix-turn-helix transcriptional regulator [Alicyclobacillus fastidiosus]|uniref:MarR family transcriptional regulator n=1 Tax=Alicyclobacillus fastidiosus TaxID=392011 RepID=A0ABV5AGP1_9BACL|nr:MarR family transcriptional regulator [Alicyclobacillus fastidiosus]WEH07944.1 MarR family transcriptional regulator [Alicyclobacillus fastidiosus]